MINTSQQLQDKQTIEQESKLFVTTELDKLAEYMEIIEKLESIKGKLESYSRRYVLPIRSDIEQTKNAIKSSETMITIHKATVNGNSEEINEFLMGMYQDKSLVEKLLKLTKKDCTPEQWKTLTIIKQHYNEYVAKKLDDLLV